MMARGPMLGTLTASRYGKKYRRHEKPSNAAFRRLQVRAARIRELDEVNDDLDDELFGSDAHLDRLLNEQDRTTALAEVAAQSGDWFEWRTSYTASPFDSYKPKEARHANYA